MGIPSSLRCVAVGCVNKTQQDFMCSIGISTPQKRKGPFFFFICKEMARGTPPPPRWGWCHFWWFDFKSREEENPTTGNARKWILLQFGSWHFVCCSSSRLLKWNRQKMNSPGGGVLDEFITVGVAERRWCLQKKTKKTQNTREGVHAASSSLEVRELECRDLIARKYSPIHKLVYLRVRRVPWKMEGSCLRVFFWLSILDFYKRIPSPICTTKVLTNHETVYVNNPILIGYFKTRSLFIWMD